jgi:hypothetical protein
MISRIHWEYRMKTFGWLMLVMSSICCVGWIWQTNRAKDRAAHFQPVDAVIVANRIHKSWTSNAPAQPTPQYNAEYLLEYKFRGQTHRYWESDPLNTTQRFRAEAVLGQMAPGEKVRVFVDPDHASNMTMNLTGWQAYAGAIVFGALALLSALAGISALTLHAMRSKSKHSGTQVVYLS